MNVGVFVDVSDFYYRIKRRFKNRKLDFGGYMYKITKDYGSIFRALAYGMQRDHEASGFIRCLQSHGFETKYKKPKIINIRNRELLQCNWDATITIDIVRLIDRLDIIVLGVSNVDFIPVIQWIRDRGKSVVIFASCVPKSLKDAANFTIEITEAELQEQT